MPYYYYIRAPRFHCAFAHAAIKDAFHIIIIMLFAAAAAERFSPFLFIMLFHITLYAAAPRAAFPPPFCFLLFFCAAFIIATPMLFRHYYIRCASFFAMRCKDKARRERACCCFLLRSAFADIYRYMARAPPPLPPCARHAAHCHDEIRGEHFYYYYMFLYMIFILRERFLCAARCHAAFIRRIIFAFYIFSYDMIYDIIIILPLFRRRHRHRRAAALPR